MRISSVTPYRVQIPFRRPFGHALHWRSATDTIILAIASSSGMVGWGEILPREYLTGETVSDLLSRGVPELAQRWLGKEFGAWDEMITALQNEQQQHLRSSALLCGWELAVLDLAGKEFGIVAADVLGKRSAPELPAGVVIGFEVLTEQLEKYCRFLLIREDRFVKIKVGMSDDIRRLEIVRNLLGPQIPLRLDANGAFTADDAIALLGRLRRLNIHSIEQPVPAHDLDGMRRVRERTGVAVVADESLCSIADARSIIVTHAADVFNIRIGKCGGWMLSQKLVRMATGAGLNCQLGTLVGETGILSNASEVFGRRVQGFDFLEGKGQNTRLLVQDIVEPNGAGSTPGLGFRIVNENLRQWTAFASTISEVGQGVTA